MKLMSASLMPDAVMVGTTLQEYARAVTVFGTADKAALAEFTSKQEAASSLRTRLDAANAAIKSLATTVADPPGATPSVTATLAPFRSGVSTIQVGYADYDAWYYGGRDTLLGDGDTKITAAIASLDKAENDASQFLRTIQTTCTATP